MARLPIGTGGPSNADDVDQAFNYANAAARDAAITTDAPKLNDIARLTTGSDAMWDGTVWQPLDTVSSDYIVTLANHPGSNPFDFSNMPAGIRNLATYASGSTINGPKRDGEITGVSGMSAAYVVMSDGTISGYVGRDLEGLDRDGHWGYSPGVGWLNSAMGDWSTLTNANAATDSPTIGESYVLGDGALPWTFFKKFGNTELHSFLVPDTSWENTGAISLASGMTSIGDAFPTTGSSVILITDTTVNNQMRINVLGGAAAPATANSFTAVADITARDAIVSPVESDIAFLADGSVHVYDGAAWVVIHSAETPKSPLWEPATAYVAGDTVSAILPAAEGGDDQFHRYLSLTDRTSSATFDAAESAFWQDLGVTTVLVGAGPTTAGVQGEAPAPIAGQEDFVLHGDSTWREVRANAFRGEVATRADAYTWDSDNPTEDPLKAGDWIWVQNGGEKQLGAFVQLLRVPSANGGNWSGFYGDIIFTTTWDSTTTTFDNSDVTWDNAVV